MITSDTAGTPANEPGRNRPPGTRGVNPWLGAVVVAVVLAIGALLVRGNGSTQPGDQPVPTGAPTVTAPASQPGQSGDDAGTVRPCVEDELPPPADEVVADIEAGGPFDYPGKDGSTFGNYEGHLPPQQRGFYREYTVRTPGVDHRGARRIVTGGFDQDDPEHWYYTGDHYESFCEFSP